MLNFHAKTEDFGLTHTVFKAFVQLAYGLKSQRIEWFLSVSKSLAYAMGGKNHNSKHSACKREGGEKKKASDKTFTTPDSRCEKNVLLNTPSFSLSSESKPRRWTKTRHGYVQEGPNQGGGRKLKKKKITVSSKLIRELDVSSSAAT